MGIAILSITKPQYLEERTLGPEDRLVAPESLLPHHHVHVGQVPRVQQLQQPPSVPGLSLLRVSAGLRGRAPQGAGGGLGGAAGGHLTPSELHHTQNVETVIGEEFVICKSESCKTHKTHVRT